ncbi:MAG: glycosyltransferase family 2 protein [Eubacteriales bacterium]|nr:glycosyltransferase family 2 protein [Eubacteriales bacterium]
MKLISFVIPCYRSEHTVKSVVDEIINTVSTRDGYDYEIILVSDASPDNVYSVICDMASKNERIKGMNLSRNFGQHAATLAGMKRSKGDLIITVDDDGQIPVNELFKLVDKIDEGYDVVFAKYDSKKHSSFRNFGSHVNNIMMEKLINKPKGLAANSFIALKRFVVDEIVMYNNPFTYIAGLVFRTTHNVTDVEVHHRKREEGHSGYTFRKLFNLWLNGFTAFSIKPLRAATYIGSVVAFIGFIYGIYIFIMKLVNPAMKIGYASLMVAILFLGGTILLVLGLIGEYIGRIYICINQSPQYVVKESVNLEEQ